MRTWIECNLPDKTGEFSSFQAEAGLGQVVYISQQTSVTHLTLDVGPIRKKKRV